VYALYRGDVKNFSHRSNLDFPHTEILKNQQNPDCMGLLRKNWQEATGYIFPLKMAVPLTVSGLER
jgi:hypothetical protein